MKQFCLLLLMKIYLFIMKKKKRDDGLPRVNMISNAQEDYLSRWWNLQYTNLVNTMTPARIHGKRFEWRKQNNKKLKYSK